MVELGVFRVNSGSSIGFLLASPQMGSFLCVFLPHQYKWEDRQRTLQQSCSSRSKDCKNNLVPAPPWCHGLPPSLLPQYHLVSDHVLPS